ncbi:MAG: hypothetical protein OEY38_05985 [Gammaproteobacteria bacterium]|nr:hypothetical protein [Gammaproteobacteria bacterium]
MNEWISINKEWLFSGIGTTLAAIILGWLFRKKNTASISAKKYSVAAKNIEGSNISIGATTNKQNSKLKL